MQTHRPESTETTFLEGRSLLAMRVAWCCAFVVSFSLLVLLGFVYATTQKASLLPNTLAIELSANSLVFTLVRYLIFLTFALMFIRLRPRDKMALLTSMMILLMSMLGVGNVILQLTREQLPLSWFWRAVALCHNTSCMVLVLLFIMLFPTGTFQPRWSRWLFPPLAILVNTYIVYLWWSHQFSLPWFIATLSCMLLLLIVPVLRFRKEASPTQRQQIKLLVLAMFWCICLQLAIAFFVGPPHAGMSTGKMITFRVGVLTSYLIAASGLSLSLIRYRLWDIDLVIHRSLVYGFSFLLLLGGFILSYVAINQTSVWVLGQQQNILAVAISTASVALLIQPSFRWLQRFVDTKIYGIGIDYRKQVFQAQEVTLADTLPGDVSFQRYIKLSLLGSGGMGDVFLARHIESREQVAIKLLRTDKEMDLTLRRKRFLREAEVLQSLKHPNIVTLCDYGEEQGQLFLAMEHVKGEELDNLIRIYKRFSLEALQPFLHDIASALDYAHQQGVVHRDIKPANIMLTFDPATASTIHDGSSMSGDDVLRSYQRTVLMDFGIARIHTAVTQLTQEGKMLGTPHYMSPEQIQGKQHIDGRTDVYASGIMVYLLVTGRFPFDREHFFSMMMAHVSQPPPHPRRFYPDIPTHTANAILKALAKQPSERFDSVSDFIHAMYEKG